MSQVAMVAEAGVARELLAAHNASIADICVANVVVHIMRVVVLLVPERGLTDAAEDAAHQVDGGQLAAQRALQPLHV